MTAIPFALRQGQHEKFDPAKFRSQLTAGINALMKSNNSSEDGEKNLKKLKDTLDVMDGRKPPFENCLNDARGVLKDLGI